MTNSIEVKLVTPDMKYSGVYLIVNLTNGKYYVGSALKLIKRKWQHFSYLKRNVHPNKHLQNAYNKNPKKFIMILIEKVENPENLLPREQYWMDELGVGDNSICYNLALKADSMLGFRHSEESRQKMSENLKGKKPNLSPEERERRRIVLLGNQRTKGVPPPNRKPVYQYDLDGNFLREYKSIKDASNSLGSKTSIHIGECCMGKRQKACGFQWRYKEDMQDTNPIFPYKRYN